MLALTGSLSPHGVILLYIHIPIKNTMKNMTASTVPMAHASTNLSAVIIIISSIDLVVRLHR